MVSIQESLVGLIGWQLILHLFAWKGLSSPIFLWGHCIIVIVIGNVIQPSHQYPGLKESCSGL